MQGAAHQVMLLVILAAILAVGILFGARRLINLRLKASGQANHRHTMQKTAFQIILLLFLASLILSGFLVLRHTLNLPFNSTNAALHERSSTFNLDFLIPAGTYIDERMTIGEVMKVRFKKQRSFYERVLRGISGLLPARYRYLGDVLMFFFWSFLYMTFLRVFTFMGYGRALRWSLILGGVTYYFMPDLSPGRIDDIIFIAIPIFIFVLWKILPQRREKRKLREV